MRRCEEEDVKMRGGCEDEREDVKMRGGCEDERM